MAREFEGRMPAVDNVLLEMEQRGRDFFDDTMRIGRVFDLLNRARVQQEFEQQVVADAPLQIEERVRELIDWLVESDLGNGSESRAILRIAAARTAIASSATTSRASSTTSGGG